MPLNFLLSTATVRRGTAFKDTNGSTRVSITPGDNELFLFIPIDDTDKSMHDVSSAFRKKYNLIDEKICDLLIYYRNEQKLRFIFVETKGSHEDGALSQLENTCNHFLSDNDFKEYRRKLDEYRKYIPTQDIKIVLLCVFNSGKVINTTTNKNLKKLGEKLQNRHNISVTALPVSGKSLDTVASFIRT